MNCIEDKYGQPVSLQPIPLTAILLAVHAKLLVELVKCIHQNAKLVHAKSTRIRIDRMLPTEPVDVLLQ